MNLITRIADAVSAFSAKLKAYFSAHATASIAVFLVIAVLLVVWARLGFTFDYSRFFAVDCVRQGEQFCSGNKVMQWETDDIEGGCVDVEIDTCVAPATCVEDTATTASCHGVPTESPAETSPSASPEEPVVSGSLCGSLPVIDEHDGAASCLVSETFDAGRCTIAGSGRTLTRTVKIINNQPAGSHNLYSEPAIFYTSTQTCGAHADPASAGNASWYVSGDTEVAPGSTGIVTYTFTVPDDCGSWQLDDGWLPIGLDAIGKVINTGVSCVTTSPSVSPSLPPSPSDSPPPSPSDSPPVSPSPSGSPPASPSESPPASPSSSPSSSPVTFSCEPDSQSVRTSETAVVRAVGGTAPYTWTAAGSSNLETDASQASVRYSDTGTFSVVVRDAASRTDTCQVTVTRRPHRRTSKPEIEIEKLVRNVTLGIPERDIVAATPTNTVEFVLRVTSVGNATARDVIVRDTLPDRLTYVTGSTTIDDKAAPDGIVAAGISLGDMAEDTEKVIRFRATVFPASFFTYKTTILTNTGFARGSNVSEVSDMAHVSVEKTDAPVKIPTGPGETTVLALIIAAIVSLLYVGYTGTDTFQRRELLENIDSARRDKDQFNFKP